MEVARPAALRVSKSVIVLIMPSYCAFFLGLVPSFQDASALARQIRGRETPIMRKPSLWLRRGPFKSFGVRWLDTALDYGGLGHSNGEGFSKLKAVSSHRTPKLQ